MGGLREAADHGLCALIVLATVAGAFFGAKALNAIWILWLLLAGAVFWVIAAHVGRAARKIDAEKKKLIEEGRKLPQALAASATYQEDWKAATEQLTEAASASELRFADGISEGRRRAVGELMAMMSHSRLDPVAMSLRDTGLVIAATTEEAERISLDSLALEIPA